MSERPPAHVGALHTHGPPGKRRSCPVRGGVGCGETGVPRGGRDGVRQGPRAPTTEEQVLPAVTMERHSARAGEEVLSCHNVEGSWGHCHHEASLVHKDRCSVGPGWSAC